MAQGRFTRGQASGAPAEEIHRELAETTRKTGSEGEAVVKLVVKLFYAVKY